MALKIATWNINSVRLRIGLVERFIAEHQPDVLCLQEIKCPEAEFPGSPLAKLGYRHVALHAQKGYHGVAILSRVPTIASDRRLFCEKTDARHVSMTIEGPSGRPLTVHNFYVPAGGDIPDPALNPKFEHKLSFLDEMDVWCADCGVMGGDAVLVGDLNVAPLETDVWSHKQMLSVVSHTPAEVDRLNRIVSKHGWVDAVRTLQPEPEKVFTWWSYRSPNWLLADKGRRLDHAWLTPGLTPSLKGATILKEARGWERPSDHVPVIVELA